MVDTTANPLLVQLDREQKIRQWETEAAQLRAEGYSSVREAQQAKAMLAIQDSLKRAAAGDPTAAWGNTYNDPAPCASATSTPSPDAPIPFINMTFGMKFGIATVCLLLIAFAWTREKTKR